jgi:hypothetical protein
VVEALASHLNQYSNCLSFLSTPLTNFLSLILE